MSRILATAAVLLAAGGVLWLLGVGPSGRLRGGPSDATTYAPAQTPRPGSSRTAPAPGGEARIRGTLRRAGEPAAGRVEVRAATPDQHPRPSLEPGEPLLAVAAGADGRWLAPGLAVGEYEIRAVAADGARARAAVRILAAGQEVRADLDLPSGPHELRGRAFHADGRPFRGCIELTPEAEEWAEEARYVARTEPDGSFVVSGLIEGPHRIDARAPGRFRREGPWLRIPVEGGFDFLVDPGAQEREIRVLAEEDDAPIPGARVRIEAEFVTVAGETDAGGVARLAVPPVEGEVVVDAPGHATARAHFDGARREITVRVGRSGRIRGRVVSADGRPIPGTTVHLLALEGDRPAATAPTDASGAFEIPDAPAGDGVLLARGNGWATPGERAWPPRSGIVRVRPGRTITVTLVAVRAARIEGRVRDREGRGSPGVLVSSGLFAGDGLLWNSLSVSVVADGDGSFAIGDVPPGLPFLVLAGDGLTRSAVGPLVAHPGETVTADLEHDAGRPFSVEVRDAVTDSPIPRARVEFAGEGPWLSALEWTAGDGVARLGPVPCAPAVVTIAHPGYVNPPEIIYGAAGPPEREIVRRRRGRAIDGVVVRPDGTPVTDGYLSAVRLDEEGEAREWYWAELTLDGTFRLAGLPEGRYELEPRFYLASFDTAETVVRAGETGVRIVVEESDQEEEPALPVRVLDPGGRPVPRAVLYVVARGRYVLGPEKWTVRDGAVDVTVHEDAEELVLFVFAARTAADAPLDAGATRVAVPASRREPLVIRLPPGLAISGRVVDAGGAGVHGVLVRARYGEEDPAARAWTHGSSRTGPDGSFRIEGLADARYVLHASPGAAYLVAGPVRAPAGAGDVTIRFSRPEAVRVRVVDHRGEPVRGAWVSVSWSERDRYRERRSGRTDQRGEFELAGCPPDVRAGISVSPPRDRRDLLGTAAADWHPRDLTVRLPGGLLVGGVVVDGEGGPARDASVWIRDEEGQWTSVAVAVDGSFRAGPFPPGRLAFWAADRERFETPEDLAVFAPAGTRNLRLVHRRGWRLVVRFADAPAAGKLGSAQLTEAETGERSWPWVGDDGVLVLEHLRADRRYDLFFPVASPGGDAYYLVRGLGPETGEIELAPRPGREVSVRLLVPEGTEHGAVTLSGPGWSVDAVATETEEGVLWIARGVPAGPCTVRGDAYPPDGRHLGETIERTAAPELEIDVRGE